MKFLIEKIDDFIERQIARIRKKEQRTIKIGKSPFIAKKSCHL